MIPRTVPVIGELLHSLILKMNLRLIPASTITRTIFRIFSLFYVEEPACFGPKIYTSEYLSTRWMSVGCSYQKLS